MTDSPNRLYSRRDLRLPSRRPHIIGALALLTLLFGVVNLSYLLVGNADDAIPGGDLALASPPLPEPVDPIDIAATDAPDLLAGEVDIGDNPTEQAGASASDVDALGNPLGGARTDNAVMTVPPPSPGAGSALVTPDITLTRQTPQGRVPGTAPDGRTPLSSYQRRAPSLDGRKPVSLIVGGLGINEALTRRAIDELPADVSLSFAAHAPDLQSWINRARSSGHEVFLELPMESIGFNPNEPGADRALRTDGSLTDNRRNLHALMARAQGYAGVINYNGDTLLMRGDAVAPILSEIKESGLGFVFDGSFTAPSLGPLSRSLRLPYAQGYGLIDPEADRTIIDARLDGLTRAAKEQPGAIGIGFAYPQTIDATKGWIASLSNDGLILVPASAALK